MNPITSIHLALLHVEKALFQASHHALIRIIRSIIRGGLDSAYGGCAVSADELDSSVFVTEDGRIDIQLDFKKKLPPLPDFVPTIPVDLTNFDPYEKTIPRMNIVVMIVGSRGKHGTYRFKSSIKPVDAGDVQPYIALGKRLLVDGHRIRIATHGTFRTFVRDNGLEFFDIGGDPHDLMSYMVKSRSRKLLIHLPVFDENCLDPGLMPGIESLTNGDIKRKRKMLAEVCNACLHIHFVDQSQMIDGCWQACHSPCPETQKPFLADAIISNPPAFAHVHCAEALGIPLLMSFSTSMSSFHNTLI